MFRLLVALVVLIVTLVVVVTEPKMHKRVMIGNKDTLAKHKALDTQNIKISPQKIETKSADIKFAPTDMSVQNMEIKREEYMKQVRMRAPKVQENHVEQIQVTNTPVPVKVQNSKPEAKPLPEQEPEESTSAVMQKLNEMIVWNQWRADICNTISDNSLEEQVYQLKKGVLFKYSFNVDRNRHISNIKVVLARGQFDSVTQESVRDIYKTIQSLEGQRILTYPKGSKRKVVKVEGGIEMAGEDVNLNSSHFSDIEY